MEKKNHNTSIFANIANAIENAVSSLFGPAETENLSVIQLHFITSQMF